MNWWFWAIVFLVVVLSLIAASNIHIRLKYSRVEDNDQLFLQFRGLYGLVRYRIEIPAIRFKGLLQGIDVQTKLVNESKNQPLSEGEGIVNQEKILRFFRKIKKLVQATIGIKDWIKETLAHLTFTSFKWDTRVGIGDAPETAILTGMVWTIKSSVLGYFFQFVKRDMKPQIRVIPQYNQYHFSTELSCVAYIGFVRMMFAGIRLLGRIMKEKGGVRRWLRILYLPRREQKTGLRPRKARLKST